MRKALPIEWLFPILFLALSAKLFLDGELGFACAFLVLSLWQVQVALIEKVTWRFSWTTNLSQRIKKITSPKHI